ncbi:hypothetical protein BJV77DRAFT_965676 [Russula vinacea]|nr:hypothetical protein BJV77DRAFT_965676 [Russula vinacea]
MAPPARSATPPPSPPPPTRPSPSYLEFASMPSITSSEPTRKLLVLDLNGTLLLRSPRPPKSSRSKYQPHPAPRRVMRRPYLTALRAYLFAPQTRAWLDVMVWSSAQPHSVEDMVLHALGDDRERLVALWARDTFGLTEDHYHRKVQTIKDLEKPWAALKPQHPRSTSSTLAPFAVAPKHQSSSSKSPGHSAATTILLDDSHAKAALQPYNHLCVPEYTRAQRNTDIAVLQYLQRAEQHSTLPPQEGSSIIARPPTGNVRKRKRKKAQEQSTAPVIPTAADGSPATLDETLLAVIGILHAARLQSSIAAWLRAGALFLPLSERGDGGSGNEGDDTKVWFDDPVLVRAWASRGREAMQELDLKVEHGIEP